MKRSLTKKYKLIRKEVINNTSKNPVEIALNVMRKDFINIHGPEHHYVDGACFLVAYRNAGGNIDLASALNELALRTKKMPGAMCGQWGICGSVTAVGAALAIIHGTGPLSTDAFYKEHMAFTSAVISRMSEIGGARCCKRNAFLSLGMGAKFVRDNYGLPMETKDVICEFSFKNQQCIGGRCPFCRRNISVNYNKN